VTGNRNVWWLVGVALGAVFVVLNLVNLVAIGGDVGRDLLGLALGAVMTAAALARYLGWKAA
jgi:hypothetical protein